jgi:hypothetical protein
VDDARRAIDRIERILAPFAAEASRLTVWFEGPGGRVPASGGHPAGGVATPAPESSREVRVADVVVGHLVASGPDANQPSTRVALDALAVSLGELVASDRSVAVFERDVAAGADGSADRHLAELHAELELGREQQRRIVSTASPDIPGYELASHYEAAREIGGDFFEVFRRRGHGRSLGVVIADVTGKGIAAGLLMAFSRPLIHGALDQATGPADALERTNRILVEERRSALFITTIAAVLELRTGTFRLANAGHESPLLIPTDGSPVRPIGTPGVLLGAFMHLGLEESTTTLAAGDTLLLYTDGVTDAVGPEGERFGDDRLLATIETARGGSAHDLVAALRAAVDDFAATIEPADDVTIVAIRRSLPR